MKLPHQKNTFKKVKKETNAENLKQIFSSNLYM